MAGLDERLSAKLRTEIALRGGVALLILLFTETFGAGVLGPGEAALRVLTLLTLGLNVLYYPIARTGWHPRGQAYGRMMIDITLITVGMYDAGGIGAAQSLGVYVIVPVYAALALSPVAAVLGTAYATASFLGVVAAQATGVLPLTRPPLPNVAGIIAFNLLIVNVVGLMVAWLSEQYRRSRRHIRALNHELERAHDASLRLTAEMQRTARLYALGEVVAGVTHEMRNLLMAASSHCHLLRRRLADSDVEAKRHTDQIDHSLDVAGRILNNVLDTARQGPAERVRVSPIDVVTRVADLKGYDVRRDGLTLRIDMPATLPHVMAVPFQLEQVLLNLVSNAHDALRGRAEPGAISVVARVDAQRVVLDVEDNGPGIPGDVLPHIFEPFYTTKASGTGLGLAISAGIVRDAGGELTARNRAEGGASFRLTLPVAS